MTTDQRKTAMELMISSAKMAARIDEVSLLDRNEVNKVSLSTSGMETIRFTLDSVSEFLQELLLEKL